MSDEVSDKSKKPPATRPRGSIREVAPGKYRVRICIGLNSATGKYDYFDQTIHGKKKDAERVRAGVARDLDLGTYIAPTRMSLNEWLDEWLKAQRTRVSIRTADGYAGLFDRYIREPLGKTPLVGLRPADIQAVYNEMSTRGLSATVIRHAHTALKSALRRAFQLGMIQRNPAEPVEVPQVVNKERRVLSPEEAGLFLKAADVMPHGLIFEFALLTGMRPEEFLALQWSDVDLVRRTATVQRVLVIHKGNVSFEKPKTPKSRRSIPLPAGLVKKLPAHKRAQAEQRLKVGPLWQANNLVFCSEVGTPLGIAHLTYRYFRPLLEKAKLPQIRLYDLRHSQATILLMADENPKVVSERLGHSTVRLTLDTYSHVLPTMQERATDKLEKMLYGTNGSEADEG